MLIAGCSFEIMAHDLPKAYEPGAIETRWAEYWIKEKLFSVPTPPPGETRPVFTLLLPPPNVTGRLHMGHMLNHTQMDIIVRWHRMRGFLTLWLPGTDHAGIATFFQPLNLFTLSLSVFIIYVLLNRVLTR